jgi:hypothetical protein
VIVLTGLQKKFNSLGSSEEGQWRRRERKRERDRERERERERERGRTPIFSLAQLFYNHSFSTEIFLKNIAVGEKLGGGAFGVVHKGIWDVTTDGILLHFLCSLTSFEPLTSLFFFFFFFLDVYLQLLSRDVIVRMICSHSFLKLLFCDNYDMSKLSHFWV